MHESYRTPPLLGMTKHTRLPLMNSRETTFRGVVDGHKSKVETQGNQSSNPDNEFQWSYTSKTDFCNN